MDQPTKPYRVLYAIAGAALLVFGLRTVLVRRITAAGAGLHGPGWSIEGEPAALLGLALGILGAYILLMAVNRDR